jgi:molecular chaperone GrpE
MSVTKKDKEKCREFKKGASAGYQETEQPEEMERTEEVAPEASAEESQAEERNPVDELESKLKESEEKYLRLQAEFQNYRKRTAKDISLARGMGVTDTVVPFLQVFDHFFMAVTAAEKADNVKAIQQGMEMILAEFNKALEDLGIVKIDATGKDFDPNLHEAVGHEPSNDVPEGKILKQWTCGYKMGERLLRPANVVVSSGELEPEHTEENTEQQKNI